MPYPARTDYATIVQTALQLLEREGIEQLSLGLVATTLGIKAPSLYRYVPSKDALLRAVNEQTFQNLDAAYQATLARVNTAPQARLLALCQAHRAFAHANPRAYILAMTTRADAQRPDERALEQIATPVQQLLAELVGPPDALPALRGLFALIHGFVMLELHDQLRRGGDLEATFAAVIVAYLAGWGAK